MIIDSQIFPLAAVEALDAGTVDDVLGHHSGGARFHLGHLRADWCEEERGLADAHDWIGYVGMCRFQDMELYDIIWPDMTRANGSWQDNYHQATVILE